MKRESMDAQPRLSAACSTKFIVLCVLQDTVDSFKKTMPLIMDLRNPAMRPRHWANLMEVVGTKFDPTGPGFTLDSVVKLHLDQHADLIADLSSNASKELAIEMSIQARLTLPCHPAIYLCRLLKHHMLCVFEHGASATMTIVNAGRLDQCCLHRGLSHNMTV